MIMMIIKTVLVISRIMHDDWDSPNVIVVTDPHRYCRDVGFKTEDNFTPECFYSCWPARYIDYKTGVLSFCSTGLELWENVFGVRMNHRYFNLAFKEIMENK